MDDPALLIRFAIANSRTALVATRHSGESGSLSIQEWALKFFHRLLSDTQKVKGEGPISKLAIAKQAVSLSTARWLDQNLGGGISPVVFNEYLRASSLDAVDLEGFDLVVERARERIIRFDRGRATARGEEYIPDPEIDLKVMDALFGDSQSGE